MKWSRPGLRLALLVGLVACGDDDDDPPALDGGAVDAAGDADAAPVDASGPDAAPLACKSPFVWTADPEARTRVQAALDGFAPGATLNFNKKYGTLSSITDLHVDFPCQGDASTAFKALLAAHPDLFQMDTSEWRNPDPDLACEAIPSTGVTLRLRRFVFGGYPMVNDIFTMHVRASGRGYELDFLGGTYVPTAPKEILAQIEGCPRLPDDELLPLLREGVFPYANFDPPPAPTCSLGPPGEYTAAPEDTLELEPGFAVTWEEGNAGILVHGVRRAILRVAEENLTPELERSSANCPDDQNGFTPRVGWIRYFDPVNGGHLGDKANPIDGCYVC